jgi:hypothetical protein
MKVAVTGHTSGIGKEIFDYFSGLGHTCIGFSRSTGHDISDLAARLQIIEMSEECDIFVNNAYNNFDDSQLNMLEEIYSSWWTKNKLIINIGSIVADFNIESGVHKKYFETKLRQDIFCRGKKDNPQILNLRFGLIDTPRVEFITNKQKMNTSDVIKILEFVLNNRESFKIISLTAGL